MGRREGGRSQRVTSKERRDIRTAQRMKEGGDVHASRVLLERRSGCRSQMWCGETGCLLSHYKHSNEARARGSHRGSDTLCFDWPLNSCAKAKSCVVT